MLENRASLDRQRRISKGISRVGLAASMVALTACGGGIVNTQGNGDRLPSLRDVSGAQWETLARRQVFFGHQSVGDNLMAGVKSLLAENSHIRLNVVDSKVAAGVRTPALRHGPVGRNFFPLEKLDEFVQLSEVGFEGPGGVAMVKLCYVDVEPNTDAKRLFDEYQTRMKALRSKRPDLTIVHFTMPLTRAESWKGNVKSVVLGRPTERDRNVVRHRYNELLRQAYAGKEPIFDIARLESTLPDGGRVFFRRGGDSVHVLAREYTYDGGHLNEAAQRRIAEQFLVLLAQLPS